MTQLILVGAALLVLGLGSVGVLYALLVAKPVEPYTKDHGVLVGVILHYVWPACLFVATALVAAALVAAGRPAAAVLALITAAVVRALVRSVIRMILRINLHTGGGFPVKGLLALLLVLVFVVLNAAAVHVTIRYVLDGDSITLWL